jgi:hypothetical protein
MLIRLIPHLDPERGDCAGYRASLDWPAVAEVHRRGNTLPSLRPKGLLTPRGAAQARSACAVDHHLRPREQKENMSSQSQAATPGGSRRADPIAQRGLD